MHEYTQTHMHTDIHTHTDTHAWIHMHTYRCKCMRTRTHTITQVHMHMHTQTHVHMWACTLTQTHLHTHILWIFIPWNSQSSIQPKCCIPMSIHHCSKLHVNIPPTPPPLPKKPTHSGLCCWHQPFLTTCQWNLLEQTLRMSYLSVQHRCRWCGMVDNKMVMGNKVLPDFGFFTSLSKARADSNIMACWLGIICWSIVL